MSNASGSKVEDEKAIRIREMAPNDDFIMYVRNEALSETKANKFVPAFQEGRDRD